ncbi:MAG TPA: hypothetical protein VF236_10780 [Gaiellaceae bacterium]
MPSWTCGVSPSLIVPTCSPSATPSPAETVIEPSCVSVTAQPSGVRMDSVLPFDGTDPAK